MRIPDLRPEMSEITAEHCSVLLERLGPLLVSLYGDQDLADILNHIDPVQMSIDINEIFTVPAFMNLFKTEFGKGVLIGAFMQCFILGGE